jgi:hypothetical protein
MVLKSLIILYQTVPVKTMKKSRRLVAVSKCVTPSCILPRQWGGGVGGQGNEKINYLWNP